MELIGESRYSLAYTPINVLNNYNNINGVFMGLNEGFNIKYTSMS